MKQFTTIFLLIILAIVLLDLSSCKEEIPRVQPIEPIPVCFEGTVDPDWETIELKDSFKVSYLPTISSSDHVGLHSSLAQFLYQQPFLNMEIGYCDDTPDAIMEYCITNAMYNYGDFISKKLPDSTISRKFSGRRIALKNVLLFCKDGETVGVLYYQRYSKYGQPMSFVGKFYYQHPSDSEHFYFRARMYGDLEGFERSLHILNSLESMY